MIEKKSKKLRRLILDGKYDHSLSITQNAMNFCKELEIEFNDSYRRALSHILKGTDISHKKENKKSPAKILIFDIETAPISAHVFGIWNQNIGTNLEMIQSDWFILTWSAKWLFEDKIYSFKITPEEVVREDDERIVKELWKIIDEADIVIGHNCNKFDNKKMNTRFLKYKLPPTSPYETIDTLLHARKQFSITSNKLDYLGEFLDVGRKVKTIGFKLWSDVLKGKQESIDDMSHYNDGDVTLLEEVYLKMRPWIKPHPNIGLHVLEDIQACPSCGSSDLNWKGEVYRTYVNEYPICKCKSCGAVSRSRKALTSKQRNKNLLVSIPK